MVFTYEGRVSGNNIRYKFPNNVTENMQEELKSTLEIKTPEQDAFTTLSHLEVFGVFKIGSPVTVTIEIKES